MLAAAIYVIAMMAAIAVSADNCSDAILKVTVSDAPTFQTSL
jgi:hypothetical protein